MLDEILTQPKIIEKIIDKEKKNIAKIVEVINKKNIEFVIIAARGTSDNAAILAKYLFEIINHIPTSLAAPSVFTLYKSKLNLKKALVIGISQSGKAPDVTEVIRAAKKSGALTVSITNDRTSPLTNVANFDIHIHAGKEKSIAATKTYTATLCALYLLSFLLANNERLLDKMMDIPQQMNKILTLKEFIKQSVSKYKYITEAAILSRGFNYATCYETALKLTETCYIMATPYSTADFVHGPVAVIEKNFPIIIFMPSGIAYNIMFDITANIKRKQPELIIISDKKQALSLANLPICIPIKIEEVLTPISYILVGQLFAYYLSKLKGFSPHKPRYLKKVTRTK